jgi:hypothetical protein
MSLEQVIKIAYERALKNIDDSLYELLSNKDDEEFYMDYKEAFGHIIEELKKFHYVED